jgi:hypothetical protein
MIDVHGTNSVGGFHNVMTNLGQIIVEREAVNLHRNTRSAPSLRSGNLTETGVVA